MSKLSRVEIVDDIVVITAIGDMTADSVMRAYQLTARKVQELRARRKPVLILLDVRQSHAQSSGARLAAKKFINLGYDRMAIFGARGDMGPVVLYVIKSIGTFKRMKYFNTRHQALRWLRGHRVKAAKPWFTVAVASAVIATSVAVWVGWQIDNIVLRAILPIPGLSGMNPVAALLFVLAAVNLMLLAWRRRPVAARLWIRLSAIIMIVCGALILARFFFGVPIILDQLFFMDKLATASNHGMMAPVAAFAFVLLGKLFYILTLPMTRFWVWIARLLVAASLVVVIIVLIGYIYSVQRLYSAGFFGAIALNTAILFGLINLALLAQHVLPGSRERVAHISRGVWLFAGIVVITQVLTGLSWQASNARIKQDANFNFVAARDQVRTRLEEGMQIYTNALYGFRAFVHGSDDVTRVDFRNYFNNTNLTRDYPGFNAISYVTRVKASQKNDFITKVRADNSLQAQGYPDFTIMPASNKDEYLVVTYVEPSGTASGFDVSSDPDRLKTLVQARDTGLATTTQTINLNASQPMAQKRLGFLIALPFYANNVPSTVEQRRAQHRGFVNAVFDYDLLFANVLKNVGDGSLAVYISDSQGNRIAQRGNVQAAYPQKTETHLNIGGQTFSITLLGPDNYGIGAAQRRLAWAIVVGGNAATVLLMVIFWSILTARNRAMRLANKMTEDLQAERDQAVVTHRQDEAILSSIGDGVFAIDMAGKLILLNNAAAKIASVDRTNALGQPYKNVLNFRAAESHRGRHAFIDQALRGKLASMKSQTVLVRADGRHIPVADSAAPIINAEGRQIGAIVVFRDISKEQELERSKDEFVSLASHQLRTPLSAIGWYVEMLLDGQAGKLTKAQQDYLQEVYTGNQRMVELVNSLLNVSRLDLGKLTSSPEPVALDSLVESLRKELLPSMQAKKLTFTYAAAKSLHTIEADPKLLRMILQNLLSNAVKYTPALGKVALSISAVTSRGEQVSRSIDATHVLIAVADNGYGIPANQQASIFNKMFRAENVQKKGIEGTGLGLYIVKSAAEKMGGKIWFESIESKGTKFFVLLPITQTKKRKT